MTRLRWVALLVVASFLAVPAAMAASPAPAASWQAAKAAALKSFVPPPPATVALSAAPAFAGTHTWLVHATVHVGPGRATACPVLGELIEPDGVSAANPQPAVLDTNGFGGAYNDSTTLGLAEDAAHLGYVALSYSGLGFGGSGCQIELDSPVWDGMAASELISWLGDRPEVLKDGPDDPRIGMIGGSYGGGIQFSTAEIDPRLDAIVPVITWNDLAYSLAPNNDTTAPVRSDAEPGVLKYQWASLFFADGGLTPLEEGQAPSSLTCPDFDPAICAAFESSVALGYPDPATVGLLRSDSMVDFWQQLHLPVLLAQGEDDSLFDIQEAVDNYHELQADGDPVSLMLQSWGHSNQTPAAGEVSFSPPFAGYENTVIADFFAHWLRGSSVSTGPAVRYFQPWTGTYATAPAWPVGAPVQYYLSGGNALVLKKQAVVAGSASFLNPGFTGSSYSETSAVQSTPPISGITPSDTPGTYASFLSQPLAAPLDVVGVPAVTVTLSGAVPAGTSPETDPVVFAKLYDVTTDGAKVLVDDLVAPVRVGTAGPVTITLPGIVHRYDAGDRLDLVFAATDLAYLGNRAPETYTISGAGPLTLPVG